MMETTQWSMKSVMLKGYEKNYIFICDRGNQARTKSCSEYDPNQWCRQVDVTFGD